MSGYLIEEGDTEALRGDFTKSRSDKAYVFDAGFPESRRDGTEKKSCDSGCPPVPVTIVRATNQNFHSNILVKPGAIALIAVTGKTVNDRQVKLDINLGVESRCDNGDLFVDVNLFQDKLSITDGYTTLEKDTGVPLGNVTNVSFSLVDEQARIGKTYKYTLAVRNSGKTPYAIKNYSLVAQF